MIDKFYGNKIKFLLAAITITGNISFLIAGCSQQKENQLQVNFSVLICPTLQTLSIGRLTDGSAIIQCSTKAAQLSQNYAIIFWTDGEISLAPIEKGGINLDQKESLISTKSFITENDKILAEYKSQGKENIVFNHNVISTDFTISTFIPKKDKGINAFLFQPLFKEALKSVGISDENLEFPKDIVLISTYLNTKNLSYVIFPVFEETFIGFQESVKVKDIILNFPDSISYAKVYLPISNPTISFLAPIAPTILPDLNLSELLNIIPKKEYYEVNPQRGDKIPIFLSQIRENIPIIAKSEDGRIFKGNINQKLDSPVDMVVLPPKDGDLGSRINFVFPKESTQKNFNLELFSGKQSGLILIWEGQTSATNYSLPISIPKDLISDLDLYYLKTYYEETKEDNNFFISEKIENYIPSSSPYIYYNLKTLSKENFILQIRELGSKIDISWKIPDEIPIDNLPLNQGEVFPNCLTTKGLALFITKKCFTPSIQIVAEDDSGGFMAIWKINGLYEKNKATLPNFIKAENIQNITEEVMPELKIKKIILSFTLYTGAKLFTYELVLRPKQ
jgi:hypothetical protein